MMDDNQLVATGTSNIPLTGTWQNINGTQCNPAFVENIRTKRIFEGPENFCYFVPDSKRNNPATCSLGYIPFLNNVNKYCTKEEDWILNRNAFAPTKHNGLCSGKSAIDVILDHDDFMVLVIHW